MEPLPGQRLRLPGERPETPGRNLPRDRAARARDLDRRPLRPRGWPDRGLSHDPGRPPHNALCAPPQRQGSHPYPPRRGTEARTTGGRSLTTTPPYLTSPPFRIYHPYGWYAEYE